MENQRAYKKHSLIKDTQTHTHTQTYKFARTETKRNASFVCFAMFLPVSPMKGKDTQTGHLLHGAPKDFTAVTTGTTAHARTKLTRPLEIKTKNKSNK